MDLRAELAGRRLMAIVRGRDPEASYRSVMVLAEEGVTMMEVSLSSAEGISVLRRCARSLGPDVLLGAGTVLTGSDVDDAVDAGARFLVSPALGEGMEKGARLGLPILPGALTPTEILSAWRLGAAAVKLFPASVFGPDYVGALRQPLPEVPVVPVGGVGLDDIGRYLSAGAVAVGVGSPLLGDAPHGGDPEALRGRVRRVLEAVAAG